jgi:hypothetical protein
MPSLTRDLKAAGIVITKPEEGEWLCKGLVTKK